jgi:hypothetical protein
MQRRYRPPHQSNYARGSWWATHAAELAGALGGFLIGFVVAFAVEVTTPAVSLGWLPWLTMLAGAVGVRWAFGRQFRQRR